MKKALSVVLTAALGLSALCTPAYASDSSRDSIALFGDSIASGYSIINGEVEYNYGEICADYLGWELTNYANPGDRTDDLCSLLSGNAEAAEAAANAEVIVISIGGNDVIRRAAKSLLSYAADNSLLKDDYTADDIPEDPTIDDVKKLIDSDKLQNCSTTQLTSMLTTLKKDLAGSSSTPGYIQNEIIPGTQQIVDKLQELNPDADIILQTVYQPLQLSADSWTKVNDKGYGLMFNQLRLNLQVIMNTYSSELKTLAEDEGVKIADVYSEFTSLDVTPTPDNQGYAHYFTDIEAGINSGSAGLTDILTNSDFHPNQKGHLAIAAAVLEQIGQLHDTSSTSLLRSIYNGLEDKSSYPAIALETYNLVAGNLADAQYTLGDVTDDNSVDARDASAILGEYALVATGGTPTFSEIQKLAGNVNGDGEIDARDASVILGYYAYISTGGTGSLEDYLAG